MENASKALIMAGSILLTIMVVGLLVYFMSQYRQFPQAQNDAERLAQVSKFNREYESYDKKEMYGTEVATVVNKVINHNKKYFDPRTEQGKIDKENNHYIDVQINILEDIKSYATQYYEVEQPTGTPKKYVDTVDYYNESIKGKEEGIGKEKTFELGVVFSANPKNSNEPEIQLLETHSSFISQNKTLESFFSDDETIRIQLAGTTKYDERNYTEVYSGFTDFKRKYFKCTEIGYDGDTQMVDLLVFEELKELDAEDKEA